MKAQQKDDYRSSHASDGYGIRYNKNYTRGYYAAQWRDLEQPILSDLLKSLPTSTKSVLDFACGTGRITRVLSEHFPHVTGVDVSDAMLCQANLPSNVKLQKIDLTTESLNSTFDAATSFRFLLNADSQLRNDALEGIRKHLNSGAYFICNIHMSSSSPMGLLYRALNKLLGKTIHKTMSEQELKKLLENNGFHVEKIIHYSFLPRPGRYAASICEKLILPVEKLCIRSKLPSLLTQSFIAVARKQ